MSIVQSFAIIRVANITTEGYNNTYEYGAVKKVPFLTSHSKMLAIIEKGKVPFSITHNTYIKIF
jgi:hypothetical protein